MNQSAQQPDFWWLPKGESTEDWLVGVGHHRPLTPDDQPSPSMPDQERPVLPGWWHSLDQQEHLSDAFQLYPIDFLRRWRLACQNTNVYRTLVLFPTSAGRESMLGPFLVDIDNGQDDIDDALQVGRQTVKLCVEQWNIAEEDCQVFFSGHKGFNIEIRPEALGIGGSVEHQVELSCQKLDVIRRQLRQRNGLPDGGGAVSTAGTGIDRVYSKFRLRHPYIRLPDSVNAWVESNSVQMSRLRTRLSIEELNRLPLAAILSRVVG
jgi:hypothetical protein